MDWGLNKSEVRLDFGKMWGVMVSSFNVKRAKPRQLRASR